jgi:hypothetical protein
MIRLWRGQGCLRAVTRSGGIGEDDASIDRVKDNAFHLEDDYGVAHAHEFFHARGIPVGEADTSVARSAANCLGIIRAMDTDSRFIQAHP